MCVYVTVCAYKINLHITCSHALKRFERKVYFWHLSSKICANAIDTSLSLTATKNNTQKTTTIRENIRHSKVAAKASSSKNQQKATITTNKQWFLTALSMLIVAVAVVYIIHAFVCVFYTHLFMTYVCVCAFYAPSNTQIKIM